MKKSQKLWFCNLVLLPSYIIFNVLQAYCQVVITVADKNEHAPQFTSSSYFGQIFIGNPDSQIGTDESFEKVVVRVRATDRDFGENARIFYSIGTGMYVMDNWTMDILQEHI